VAGGNLKGAIVYYGEWGHCKSLAEMIIKGLLEQGHEVALLEPETTLPEGREFLVVGAPTKLGTLPREIRRFVARRLGPEWKGKPFAAFSSGDAKLVAKGERQAADIVYDALVGKELIPAAPPFKASVDFMKGPLSTGMHSAAYKFGQELGEALAGAGGDKVTFR
jgi:flavodoxin